MKIQKCHVPMVLPTHPKKILRMEFSLEDNAFIKIHLENLNLKIMDENLPWYTANSDGVISGNANKRPVISGRGWCRR